MKLTYKPNQMLLSLDNCAQLEIIMNAVQCAAFDPRVADSSCVTLFGADRSELREFFEELNVEIDPNYRKGSYDAALRAS